MADVSTRIKHDERERMTMLEFCEFCRKEKKREKKNIQIKKRKQNEIKTKPRKKEEIFSSYFFSVWNVNLGRDNRMRKILRWRVLVLCVYTFALLVAVARNIFTWAQKGFGRLSSPVFSFFSLSRLIARYSEGVRDMCVACRAVRVRICVVLRMRESARV